VLQTWNLRTNIEFLRFVAVLLIEDFYLEVHFGRKTVEEEERGRSRVFFDTLCFYSTRLFLETIIQVETFKFE